MRCWLLSTFLYLILHLTCAEVSLLCEISTRVSFSSLDGLVSTSFEFSGILPGGLTSFVGYSKSYSNQTFASATFFRAMFFYKCVYDQFLNNQNWKTFQTQIFTLRKIRWTLWDLFFMSWGWSGWRKISPKFDRFSTHKTSHRIIRSREETEIWAWKCLKMSKRCSKNV